MIIANHSFPQATIIIPDDASSVNRFAADELNKYLNKICGANFWICGESDTGRYKNQPEICVGPVKAASDMDTSALKNDGYMLKTVGTQLFILGENDRALLYGVYGLLEDVLGCRFFAQNVESVPQRSRLEIPNLDRTVVSPVEYRETSWNALTSTDIAYKRGLNGHRHGNSESRGGCVNYWGFAHTLFNYVHPDEYFEEHPEYFSMINGERIRERTQLCLTNPEVLEITKKKLRERILAHPECKIFSLTQMDWYNPCQCPECAKIDEEEGSHAGTMIRFVNACAESIAEEFPDILIDTFAYQYTRQPPKLTKPLPNVCVRICTIECCFSHPLAECDEIAHFKDRTVEGATFQNDMRGWAKLCNRMFVWDYTTNFWHYLNPMPNFHVLQPNIKFFLENGVTGLFEQGNGQGISGEFGELRAYLISKLMWNPDLDVSEAMNEFLFGYYGKAAVPLRTYIDLMQKEVTEKDVHYGIYCAPDQGHIPEAVLVKAEELFDRAEMLAENDEILSRVQRARLQIRYTRLYITSPENPTYAAQAEKLISEIQRFGLTYIKESCPLEKSFDMLRSGDLPRARF